MVASAFGDTVGCGDWDMGSGLVGFWDIDYGVWMQMDQWWRLWHRTKSEHGLAGSCPKQVENVIKSQAPEGPMVDWTVLVRGFDCMQWLLASGVWWTVSYGIGYWL